MNGTVDMSKDDSQKLKWHLMPFAAAHEILRVLSFGAFEKPRPDGSFGYGVGNWRTVPDARTRYANATIRHVVAYLNGERRDPESGLHPLAHAACSAIFACALDLETPSTLDPNGRPLWEQTFPKSEGDTKR